MLPDDSAISHLICQRCNLLGVPAVARNLFRGPVEAVIIKLAVLLGGNDRDLIIELAILVHSYSSLAVGESMAVELRRLWLAGEFTKPLA